MALTDEQLDAIKARTDKATAGPWSRERPASKLEGWHGGTVVAGTPGRQTIYADPPGGSYPSADCDFIAHARTDVPALLAEVERLRARERATMRVLREMLRAYAGNGKGGQMIPLPGQAEVSVLDEAIRRVEALP